MSVLPTWENPEVLDLLPSPHISSSPVSHLGQGVSINCWLILGKYTSPNLLARVCISVSSADIDYRIRKKYPLTLQQGRAGNLSKTWMHLLSRGQPAKIYQLAGLWVHRLNLLLALVLNPNFRTEFNKLKSQVQIYPLCTKKYKYTSLHTWE